MNVNHESLFALQRMLEILLRASNVEEALAAFLLQIHEDLFPVSLERLDMAPQLELI